MAEEAIIQQEILDYLLRTGWMAWNNSTTGMMMKGRRVKNKKKGSPDIEALKQGRYLACEVKGPNARVQPHQLVWLENVANHGGLAIVVNSLDDVVLAISQRTMERGVNEAVWFGKTIKFRP